jgi:hypothetical protein
MQAREGPWGEDPIERGRAIRYISAHLTMPNSFRFLRLPALLLFCSGLGLHAQELTYLSGTTTTDGGAKDSSYAWQIDYRQDFYKYFASSVAYINEGHLPDHHRDGTAWEAWANVPFLDDRIALSLGAGVYYFYDTESLAGNNSTDVHGTAPIFSLALTGYFSDRVFYRLMINRITPSDDTKTTTAAIGVGYWFGERRRPVGNEPDKTTSVEAQYITNPQLTIFGGQTVVNALLSPKAYAAAAEYRQGLLPHLDGTASFIYEGDPKIERRSGVALQLWAVNTFLDESTSVGIGVGPYIFIDKNHPVNSGQTVNVGLKNPAAVAPMISLTIARQLSDSWIARIIWDRVTSNYNRDSDIFLAGIGYSWR